VREAGGVGEVDGAFDAVLLCELDGEAIGADDAAARADALDEFAAVMREGRRDTKNEGGLWRHIRTDEEHRVRLP